MPFEYADRSDNLVTEHDQYGLNMSHGCTSSTADPVDPVTALLSQIEGQQQKVFVKAEKQMQKPQKHQAKWYNIRNAAGEPLEIDCIVLKKMNQLNHKSKLYNCFTGPYSIIGHCSTGSYYLHDKYGHNLSRTYCCKSTHSVP